MERDNPRPGEEPFAANPAELAPEAGLVFIGRIVSPWLDRSDCPKNLREARERGRSALIELDPLYWPATHGLEPGMRVHLLYWMNEARRDLAIQAPRHRPDPVGTFALRSPVRPNPIALANVSLIRIAADTNTLEIDAIDCISGTPLLDIKPFLPSVDVPSE